MSRQIRRFGPYFLLFATLIGLSMLLVPTPRMAEATTYSTPFYSNNSPSPECAACCLCPPCPRPAEWVEYSVHDGYGGCRLGFSARTGEVRGLFPICRFPGRVQSFDVFIMTRSYLSGGTQVGGDAILSFEHTVEEEIIDTGDPDSEGGTEITWRPPFGLPVLYYTDGSGGYATDDCSVHHTLSSPNSGIYKLTDKYGNTMLFDANGMPDTFSDRNGNDLEFTYNSSYQITGLTDTRGQTWSFSHNTAGFLSQIGDPAGNDFDLNYDTGGFLTSIDYPATTDQP
nr:hypothetical protein [Planctomycetota bacterium]